MFDILIGTLIPSRVSVPMIKQLNPKGFECYEINFDSDEQFSKIDEFAKEVGDVLEDKKISAIACYGNTMCDDAVYRKVETLINNAEKFNCDRVCMFAGGDPEKSVPDNIPLFKKTFEPLSKLAEAKGVKLGFENCGGGWGKGTYNIAFSPIKV